MERLEIQIQNDKTAYLPQFKINLSVREKFQEWFFDGVRSVRMEKGWKQGTSHAQKKHGSFI